MLFKVHFSVATHQYVNNIKLITADRSSEVEWEMAVLPYVEI